MTQRQKIAIAQTQRLALNTNLHASIRLLRGDTAALTRLLEEEAADNPHLRVIAPEPARAGDWLPRWSGVLAFGNRGPAPSTDDSPAASPSLVAHVLQQVQALGLRRDALRIAVALIEALEPSGWLGRDLSDIASELDHPLDEVEAVLLRLQTLEPTGIFARGLSECLALQAKEEKALDREMVLILRNLDILAQGNLGRLARLCDCDEAAIQARFRIIRRLNPKPGADFSPVSESAALQREPDLLARPLKGGRWQISLNRSALPALEVVEGDRESRDPARIGAAKALGHMLQARNATLLRVGREIAERQKAALLQGPEMLVPMTMADVANRLGLHESTISRVVAGASLDSPRGVWWLRQMFSGAKGKSQREGLAAGRTAGQTAGPGDEAGDEPAGPGKSAAALRHRLGRIIAGESALSPLSDAELAQRLAEETGVSLARRTVAKYREMQGIPPAHRRRKQQSPVRRTAKPGRAPTS